MGSNELTAMTAILRFTDEGIFRPGPGTVTYPLPDQEIGSIAMPQGRLITFPNGLEYRNEPIELIDPTLPGHRRCIMLHLVDPNIGSAQHATSLHNNSTGGPSR